MKFTASILAVFSTLSFSVLAQGPGEQLPSIADVLMDPNFSDLAAALNATGLDEALVGGGPFTVFAPTNDAFDLFEAASPGTLAMWLAESPPDTLIEVLLYHVADGVLMAADIEDGMSLAMLSGDNATLMADPPMIETANIVAVDIMVQEGVVHVIDSIIVPSGIEAPPESTVPPTPESSPEMSMPPVASPGATMMPTATTGTPAPSSAASKSFATAAVAIMVTMLF